MYQLTAPNAICGRVIGRGGSKINSITVRILICPIWIVIRYALESNRELFFLLLIILLMLFLANYSN